jgi:polysaccharide biosynthesis transport protein
MKVARVAIVLALIAAAPWQGFSMDEPAATYTSTGWLRVSRQVPFIIFPPAHQDSEQEFSTYKRTQAQLVKSRFVMLAALRKPEVAKLPAVQAEQQIGDVARWLESLVKVEFPGHAELMSISVATGDPQESATLARAVVDAYLAEVVNAEEDQKRRRLSEMDRAYVENEMDIRRKLEDLKRLADTLGVSAGETSTVKQQLALEDLVERRKELRQLQADLRGYVREMVAQKALLDGANEADVAKLRKEVKHLDALISATANQESEMKKTTEQLQKEAERFETPVVDIEMMRADLKNARAILAEIDRERNHLKIEVRATPRVTLVARPEAPEVKD